MRKCTGNNTQDWGFDAIFEVRCPNCTTQVESFKDEITGNCPQCGKSVQNDRKDYGCGQWCSSSSPHMRNWCPKFKQSKHRFYDMYLPTIFYWMNNGWINLVLSYVQIPRHSPSTILIVIFKMMNSKRLKKAFSTSIKCYLGLDSILDCWSSRLLSAIFNQIYGHIWHLIFPANIFYSLFQCEACSEKSRLIS